MKVIAFNGSPRENWNTHTLLKKVLEGAADNGAETQIVHLHKIKFTGCKSCFACSGPTPICTGKCVLKDDLRPILHSINDETAIVIGSPIYFNDVTGVTRSMMERLMFQYHSIDYKISYFFKKKVQTGMIYTMGATEEESKERGYDNLFALNKHCLEMVFGIMEQIVCYDTYQHEDYSTQFTFPGIEERKAKRRQNEFLVDCRHAYEMGVRFALGNGDSKNSL